MFKGKIKKTAVTLVTAGSLMFAAAFPGAALANGPKGPGNGPKAPDKPLAKNVILMISDGMGYNQLEAADLYQYGKTGAQPYEKFPFKFGMSTYSVGSYDPAQAWSSFDYVKNGATDSAAAATAMSTGVKTNDRAIGVDMNDQPLKHVTQLAEELGKSTGVISSVQISHATPAGFVAHNVNRNNYAQIAQEMIENSATDVIMGAGHPKYDNNGVQKTSGFDFRYVGSESIWNGLAAGTVGGDADGDGTADPWTLIQTREQFQNMGTGDTPKRVIGVAQAYTTLQQSRGGDGKAGPYVVPLNQNVPTLAEMTRGALNVLDNNSNGFFLMVEGGAVDWAGHANQSGRVIEEQIDFNNAVEAVIDWVNQNSNWGETLLIVTGDHETGYLTGPGSGTIDGKPVWTPLVNNGKGNLPGMQWNSGNHTNSLIPVFAKGDAGRLLRTYADETDPVRGKYVDNTEVAKLMFDVLQ